MDIAQVTNDTHKASPSWGGLVFLVLVVIALLLLVNRLYQWALDEQRMPVQVINISGELNYLNIAEVEETIRKKHNVSFVALDVDAVHADVESHPWVYRASVRKHWPHQLSFYIIEQTPVARWNEDGVLNPYGEVFFPKGALDKLPILYGPNGSEKVALQGFQAIQTLLATQGLGVQELFLSERFAWQLVLKNSVVLYLGRTEFIDRVQRFVDLYPLLTRESREMDYVDLRYDTGLAVRWRDVDREVIEHERK